MRLVEIAMVATAAHAASAGGRRQHLLPALPAAAARARCRRGGAFGDKYHVGGDGTAERRSRRNAGIATRIPHDLKDMTGAVLSPQDAALLLRGLKTLALRMDRHCAKRNGGGARARGAPGGGEAYYPGWRDPPARTGMPPDAPAGGMVAFDLHGPDQPPASVSSMRSSWWPARVSLAMPSRWPSTRRP